MKSQFIALLGLVALTTAASIGCAETADVGGGDENDEATEDALTRRQLPGVAIVEIAEVRGQTTVLSSKTLGAPKKIQKIMSTIHKLKPTDPVPRCLERDTERLTFMDASGKKVATVGSYCGGYGSISFENGTAGYGVHFDAAAVDAAKTAPLAVGDFLWAVSKIELSKPREQEKKTITGDGIKPILDGFDLDEVPDPTVSMPRCLPSHVVTFKRGNAEVAYTSFVCGSTTAATAPASLKASFSGADPAHPDADSPAHGAINLDPRPILKAFEARR